MSGAPDYGQFLFEIANRAGNKHRKQHALDRLARLRNVLMTSEVDLPGAMELFEAIDLDLAYIESQIRSIAT